MRSFTSLTLFVLLCTSTTAFSHPYPYPHSYSPSHRSTLVTRQYVTDQTLADSYDFVIAGGGVAGLSLANRLSENFTVLVIETGDLAPPEADVPANTYYKSLFNGPCDYAYHTVAQPSAGGRNVYWPRGKVLGGSSAINGMYLIRPHEIEVNAWHDLISSQPDADSWTWDNLFTGMKKSETFTPPTMDTSLPETAGINKFNSDSHGVNGPVHHSYPAYMVPISQYWLPTLEAAGIATNPDAYSGRNVGGFFSLSAINPSNWTRSYARPAYIDPLPPRTNLHILIKTSATRILFDSADPSSPQGLLKATSVEFSSGRDAEKKSVKVNKEVIISGGTVNSPQILQLSGVGPSEVLKAAGVDVKLDLAGVGMHLQDHLSAGVFFESKEDTQGNIYQSGSDFSKSPQFLSFINSGVAYVNSTTLFGGTDGVSAMQKTIKDDMSTFISTATGTTTDAQIIEGFKNIYTAISDKIFPSEAPLVELLFSINVPGQVAVQAGLQHALSQGRVYINSSSVFDSPVVDPQYLTHWADVVTLREGFKLARRIAQTPPLSTILGAEVQPGSSVVTDDDWDNWLKNHVGTEFHPTSTCAMLPKEQGGVVDNKMKVFGTSNVRVVDASVFPVNFGAHTMAPLYGAAEIAADIIKKDYTNTSSTSPASTASPSQGGGGSSNQGGNKNGGSVLTGSMIWTLGLASVLVLFAVL